MDSIYTLILTALSYILFVTIVDVFISTNPSTQLLRIKTKVFFQSFGAPIIFGLVILSAILTENKGINIFFGLLLISGTLIRAYFGERKYLTKFKNENSQLEIKYLTSFLKAKYHSFDLTEITNLEMERPNWLIGYPAAINIKSKNKWTKFYLIDKKLKSLIQGKVDAANKSIAAIGAGH